MSAGSMSALVVTTPSGSPVIDLSALNPSGAVLSSAEADSRRTLINREIKGKIGRHFYGLFDFCVSIYFFYSNKVSIFTHLRIEYDGEFI